MTQTAARILAWCLGRVSVPVLPQRVMSLPVLCMVAVGLSSCKPELPKMGVDAPFITCAAFDFRVSDSDELKEARRHMFEAAMTLDIRFVAEAPFSGFRDVIGGRGHPMTFVLSSEGGPWSDEFWLRVEYLAGGPPHTVPWLPDHKQPYVPPAECLARSVDQFAKLRELFSEKWPLTELDINKPIPLRSRQPAASRSPEK
ncbi:hypothetical protein [Eleftheria terrae]|uniref:hypothetical protein n=1 Tax=Eleftheria terrae TaxID=1597781 RepID=UPI00263B3290|nr:hypothetical protein [Eleftheria terrae]WKB56045.1 hypothetical protein N7L95_28705 [Eleftheria terrae]